jgi:hypothetical protein
LRPEWDFREVFENERVNLFLIPVGKGTNSCGGKWGIEKHGLS